MTVAEMQKSKKSLETLLFQRKLKLVPVRTLLVRLQTFILTSIFLLDCGERQQSCGFCWEFSISIRETWRPINSKRLCQFFYKKIEIVILVTFQSSARWRHIFRTIGKWLQDSDWYLNVMLFKNSWNSSY